MKPRRRSPHEVIVTNMAQAIREKARESNQTIEAYTTEAIRSVVADADAVALFLSAIGRIAAEDDRSGAGPLRAHKK